MAIRPPSVLLVSIDALQPGLVHRTGAPGPRLPHLREGFVAGGAAASGGVRSVLPSFTYACHQTIITGTRPATHGIHNNLQFDPDGRHKGAWNWFVSERVPTLWQLALEHGYRTASVAFPTSAGAPGDFILPEFWWDGGPLDLAFLDTLCRPQGLAREADRAGCPCPGGLDLTLAGDRKRQACASWLLETKLVPALADQPFFLSTYFGSYDETAHQHGVRSPEALATLEALDGLLGELVAQARAAAGGDLVVAVVSDHGSLDNTCSIRPNVLLRKTGLVSLDERGRVAGWRAWCQRAGGTAEIRLHDAYDLEARRLLQELLQELKADPDGGIREVLTGEQARRERGGFPLADFVLVGERGCEFRDEPDGPYRGPVTQAAQHGYSEEFEEMRAWFGLSGRGIPAGCDLGALELADVAPTLAGLMGFAMPTAEGRDLGDRLQRPAAAPCA